MANSVNTQLILDGPRHCVVKIDGVLDTSDLASMTIADPALLQGMDHSGLVKAKDLIVERINYSVEDGLECRLSWDATTPVRIDNLTGRGLVKSERFGGIPNNSGAGRTGKVLLATEGWTTGKTLSFTLTIEFIKQGTL
jgi:hypothetical protein